MKIVAMLWLFLFSLSLFAQANPAVFPDFSRYSKLDLESYFAGVETAILYGKIRPLLSPIPKCVSERSAPLSSVNQQDFPKWLLEFYVDFVFRFAYASYSEIRENCSLTFEEYEAIRFYTSHGHRIINEKLRSSMAPPRHIVAAVDSLKSAVKKVPIYHGLVLRGGSREEYHSILKDVKKGIYTLKTVLSTSRPTYISFFQVTDLSMLIYSKTCGYVKSFSAHPEEEEVICPPGTRFRIWWSDEKEDRQKILMEELVESSPEITSSVPFTKPGEPSLSQESISETSDDSYEAP